ncbi:hypothetical protein [Aquirufa regiilacus]|uniref:Methylase-associated X1 domain-containing protein n=1 Tax=Aquirufa regiilacus TaxID=3024868 RepID=A0ABU3TSY5_9BACT|nr:hypothetical protein [Aquirufa sp. LEOWEIH-7C]MDU0808968.1 hypothetical protein [Aquirufa sp. LEOWEIH-7C]
MRKILAKELKIKFIDVLSELIEFSYDEGNPFLIKIRSEQFFVFLKNLSPAYFKNSPDITRVQLPFSNHFSKISNADIPFIILGYDVDNDSMVCWNPLNVKQRLNAKSNISLYSRESLQSNVKPNEFKSGYLSNGEKIIIFKRVHLPEFFDNISTLFGAPKRDIISDDNIFNVNESLTEYVSDKLLEITEESLILELTPLLMRNKVLEAVEVCSLYYKGKYEGMTFKDWYKLVNKYYQKINSQG